jgi:hypothetical protein
MSVSSDGLDPISEPEDNHGLGESSGEDMEMGQPSVPTNSSTHMSRRSSYNFATGSSQKILPYIWTSTLKLFSEYGSSTKKLGWLHLVALFLRLDAHKHLVGKRDW